MAEFNFSVNGGDSIRLKTAGKYCDRDIVVTGAGGSDYDGLICYDVTKYIEMMPDFPIGVAMARVSNTCPDLTGKKCIMAGQIAANLAQSIEDAGEVQVLEETDEYGNPVKAYMVSNPDGTPLCAAIPEEFAHLLGANAGVWVLSLYTSMLTSYIMFA